MVKSISMNDKKFMDALVDARAKWAGKHSLSDGFWAKYREEEYGIRGRSYSDVDYGVSYLIVDEDKLALFLLGIE